MLNRTQIVFSATLFHIFASVCAEVPSIELHELNGQNGFTINGASVYEGVGGNVSAAGDINNDGIDDVLVSSTDLFDRNEDFISTVYAIYGSDTGFSATYTKSDIDGDFGFKINHTKTTDSSELGIGLNKIGDFNNDGRMDFLVSNRGHEAGKVFVVFGQDGNFSTNFKLTDLNGTNGFTVAGGSNSEEVATQVSSAGDFNNDGFDDIMLTTIREDINGLFEPGVVYVLYGHNNSPHADIDLGNLNGSMGFKIIGESSGDWLGLESDAVGDFNGDGFDDLILGAIYARNDLGASYVVFGTDQAIDQPLAINSLNGTNGFAMHGKDFQDYLGFDVSGLEDLNADGFDDIMISSWGSDHGEVYVIYGTDQPFSSLFDLSSLNGNNGFTIVGSQANRLLGEDVVDGIDFNDDSILDLFLCSGSKCVLLFGKSSGMPSVFDFNDFDNHSDGIEFTTTVAPSWWLVGGNAGDLNNDGVEDLIIGNSRANINGNDSGSAHVVFGIPDLIYQNSFE